MELLNTCVHDINRYLWGVFFLIPLLCGTGIFYTIRLRFVQVRYFGWAARYLFGGASLFGKKADQSGMSSFQALATAVAAQVGTGNVAGTATAIVSGGPGALFWLWLAAFFGMATIFAEAVLALTFRTRDASGHIVGGPAYYMPILSYADEIHNAVLLVHGEKAHSRYFSESTFKKLKGDNKELVIVPDASHTDLYDNLGKIPFDKIASFLRQYLK